MSIVKVPSDDLNLCIGCDHWAVGGTAFKNWGFCLNPASPKYHAHQYLNAPAPGGRHVHYTDGCAHPTTIPEASGYDKRSRSVRT